MDLLITWSTFTINWGDKRKKIKSLSKEPGGIPFHVWNVFVGSEKYAVEFKNYKNKKIIK